MTNIFFQTILFYLIYLISLLSITGYGIIFKSLIFKNSQEEEIFSTFFLGLPLLLFISFMEYVFIGFFPILNLLIISIGFLYFILKFKISRKFFKLLIIPSVLFFGLIISKTHEDFGLYHFPHLSEIISGEIKLGLGNLEHRYVYASMFSYIQGIFYIPFLKLKLFHVPSFLIYVALVSYLFENIKKNINPNLQFLFSFLILLLLSKFTRLSEFGYDYICHFLIIFLFCEFLISKNKDEKIVNSRLIIHYLFAVSIKIISLFFAPVILYFLISNKFFQSFFKEFKFNYKFLFPFLVLIGVIFANSFFKTGCIFYGLKNTCLSKEKISWSVPYKTIKMTRDIANQWTKGYSHQDKDKFILSQEIYLSNFNWVSNWIKKHFFYRINEFIILILFLYLISYLFCTQKEKKVNFSKNNLVMFLLNFVGLFLWFIFLPQFRFGISLLIFTFYYLFWNFSYSVKQFNYRRFLYLFLIVLTFFNFKNLNRIKNEINREDIYKFSNFPWYAMPERKYKTKYDLNGNIYYQPNDNIRNCLNIPTICTFNDINIEAKKRLIKIKTTNN